LFFPYYLITNNFFPLLSSVARFFLACQVRVAIESDGYLVDWLGLNIKKLHRVLWRLD